MNIIVKTFHWSLTLSFCLFTTGTFAQTSHKLLMKGDKFYESGDFLIAEESYRKAADKKKDLKSTYNLGNSLFQQERHEEAIELFQSATNKKADDFDKGNAHYNLGNAQLKAGQLEEAIESFKEAILLNPEDDDAKRNLYLAKLMQRQEQQQEQQEQQEQQQNQDNQEEQEQQEQEQQEQDQQQEQDEQSQEQQGEQGEEEKEEEQSGEETQQMTKEDAARLLEAIENEEKKVQEKLRKVSGSKKKPEKDW